MTTESVASAIGGSLDRAAKAASCLAIACLVSACGYDEPLPSAGNTNLGLSALWGSAADDVWAVGDEGAIFHFDGRSWQRFESGTNVMLLDVWGSGPNDVWACGEFGTIAHWDGTSWTAASSNEEGDVLLAVWGRGANAIWFGGVSRGVGYLVFYGGEHWQFADVPGAASVWDIWGNDKGEAWLAGSNQGNGSSGILYHFDGTQWNLTTYAGESLRAGWASGESDVWVVGYDSPLQHWDGNAWLRTEGESERLFTMWGTAPDNLWSAGDKGHLLHYDGREWRHMDASTTHLLRGIWGSAENDMWISGAAGTLLHWNGASFTSFGAYLH